MSSMIQSIKRWWGIDAVGLLSLALVTALCYAVLIYPAVDNRRSYEQLQPQVAERAGEVERARASLASLQNNLEQTQFQLEDLPLRLESAAGVNSRLASLAELASNVGLDVHQMLPDTARAGQRYDIVPIILSGSGDYAQVTQFMHDVHDRFADVAVVGFDLAAETSGSQTARFDIGLAWYTLPVMGFVEN